MNTETRYLRPDVIAEPLVNQWYAWPHLVAPATLAMNVANAHVKIMQSYLASPQVHAAAVKNPAMLGGPFLDVPVTEADRVRDLLDRTTREEARALALAAAIAELDELLAEQATGYSLEPLYARVPEPLRGYVELVYDLRHRPSIRLLERLLYEGPHHDPGRQSVALSRVDELARPFVFSTPRLETDGAVHLKLPFADSSYDELFRARSTPVHVDEICERLGGLGGQADLVRSFFTPEPPRAATDDPPGDAVRVRYFGHACVAVEWRGTCVLADPVLCTGPDPATPRYSMTDLPERVDYVVITHGHSDHLALETLLQIRHRVGTVVVPRSGGGALEDPSLKLILERCGFRRVVELDDLETLEIEGGSITGLPFLGEHGDLNIRAKLAYAISLGGRSVVCAADSSNLEPRLYDFLRDIVGAVDALFLGMECDGAPQSWVYGALSTAPLGRRMDGSRRLCGSDYGRAAEIVGSLVPDRVFVYAMGQEPWLRYLTSIVYTSESKPIVESDRLVAHCRDRGIEAERLYGTKQILLSPVEERRAARG